MSIVTLHLPEVKYCQAERPSHCPYCSGETFQRWGGSAKRVSDPHLGEVWVYRYRCCHCRRTFRHYPVGIDRARQTARMRALAAIGWIFGMSYRCASRYLGGFGIGLSRMSIWRDVQLWAEQLKRARFWKEVRVLGVDGAYVRGWGKRQAVLVTVDMGTGEPVAVGYIDEKDPRAVKRFLQPLVQRLGVSVIVTDDLSSYKQVAEALGVEQQICQFHVRRWVGLAIHELKQSLPQEWLGVAEEVRQILRDLPIEGDKRLVALSRQFPASRWSQTGSPLSPVDKLRLLILRLVQTWSQYRVFDWQPDVPWTNNPTEQVIGRMKMRARTVRGYKTWPGMASGLMAAGAGVA